MKLPQIISDSRELLQIAGEKLTSNPTPTIAVSSYSILSGMSAFFGWFKDVLPSLAIFAGFVGAVVLAQLNWVNRKKAEIDMENSKLQGRILREQMRTMNIELRTEDEKTGRH